VKTRSRIKKRLQSLKNNQSSGHDIKKLKAWGKDAYRLRVGKIRIIYEVINSEVIILDIDYRGNIY
jgi:mRNA-degrading endonuclease RelE of RelBE toxin-antitoxin system